jgi:broad specificity phosphatase PhoE
MITFLRHGESENNKYHLHIVDPSLTAKGKKQASLLSGHFDYIMISPLKRTIETFNNSSITGDNIEYSSLCRENIYSHSDLMQGENLMETREMFEERLKLLKLYIKTKKYKNILIITHHGVIYNMTGYDLHNAEYTSNITSKIISL